MAWLELRLDTDPKQAAVIEESLLECGALAVTYTDAGDQPILEPGVGEIPLWPEIVLVALFDGNTETDTKITELQLALTQISGQTHPNQALPNHRWDILEEKIWEREWLQHHKPVQFGQSFWVFHEKVVGAIPTLLLDPGLAFGTGSHPTTALCLEWIAQKKWASKQLIDYGCGSGILAVAASLLGCQSVQCTDIDPQALVATRANAQRNLIDNETVAIYLAGQEPDIQADVLVANILAGPLVQLCPAFAAKIKAGGQICLSGILAAQEADIRNAYIDHFEDLQVENLNGWLRVTGTRRDF